MQLRENLTCSIIVNFLPLDIRHFLFKGQHPHQDQIYPKVKVAKSRKVFSKSSYTHAIVETTVHQLVLYTVRAPL